MDLTHAVRFGFALGLPPAAATAFVRDVRTSLAHASFIEDLSVEGELEPTVSARLPVNAALFGQRRLEFRSRLQRSPHGARLLALPFETDEPGWAEVAGEAEVRPDPAGSWVAYSFDITIHLRLPKAEKWGGQALTKMIHYTAQHVLTSLTAEFPAAVQAAAREVEASYAA